MEMSRLGGGLASWQQNNLRWMEDDDDQDSDTDSKLSGSAIVDSVMKRLRKHGHYKDHSYMTGGDLLDPIRDSSFGEQDEESHDLSDPGGVAEEQWGEGGGRRGIRPSDYRYHPGHSGLANGYSHQHSPGNQRRAIPGGLHSNSPRHAQRPRDIVTSHDPSPAAPLHVMSARAMDRRKKEVLSPVPETTQSGAHVVELSGPGGGAGVGGAGLGRSWGGSGFGGPGNRSMESLPQAHPHSSRTPPTARREDRITGEMRVPYRPVQIDSYHLHSRSQEALQQFSHHDRYDGAASEIHLSPYHPPQPRRSSLGSNSGGGSTLVFHSHSGSGSHSGSPGLSRAHSSGVSHPHAYGHSAGFGTGAIVGPPPLQPRSRTRYDSPRLSHDHLRGADFRPPYENIQVGTQRTPPTRRATNYDRHELPRDPSYHSNIHSGRSETSASRLTDASSSHDPMDRSFSAPRSDTSREPNLNDVVDFLGSEDPGLVSNAASYLQHLAYGDDSMKAKIRQYGAIPVLVSQLRNPDIKVQIAVIGALRNLSYGRSNDDNKLEIAGEHGLPELVLALRMCRFPEVRDPLTSLLWNLSSCEDLKLRIIKTCLQELVEHILVPYSGWSLEAASELMIQPGAVQWNPELKNATGTMRNLSSAGEPARVFMRACNGLVDSLMWILRSAVLYTDDVNEKTVENVVCILRNLSYQLESEIDPQDGADDVLDREWEAEQRREMEDTRRGRSVGCFAFLRPSRSAERPMSPRVARHTHYVNFANPDPTALPRRHKPVYGVALLWQPEVVYPYLALIEHYVSCSEALEAAAGAIQNLTACTWKWAVYSRNIIRTSNGLRVIADLLNNGHDAVVKAAATALRNLSVNQRNKASLGVLVMTSLIPRLPFGSNHLGISEPTTIALLCLLMELCLASPENAKLLHDKGGVPFLARLSRSRQHTTKIIFAANKVCSILYEHKDCKAALKREGWEMSQYQRLARDNQEHQLEFERGSMSQDYRGSKRKTRKKESSKKKRRSKKEKKREERSHQHAGVRVEEVHMEGAAVSLSPSAVSQASHSTPRAGPPDPMYSEVEKQDRQITTPLGIYQTIEDAQTQGQGARSEETRAPSITSGPTAPSTSSGAALSPVSPDEEDLTQQEPDPNAIYAQVDIEKKRASRRQRKSEVASPEHQINGGDSQQGMELDAIDSWV